MLDSWKKNELVNPGFNYGTEDDYNLRFFPPGELEIIRNAQNFDVKFEDYRPRSEFSYLKEGFLNLEEMRLTDKQLMAVSLVFYGVLKKARWTNHENQQSSALRPCQCRPEKNERCFEVKNSSRILENSTWGSAS